MRYLAQTLLQESPLTLAREVIWRTRRKWEKNSHLARSRGHLCPVRFRQLPYYAPDRSVFSSHTIATLTSIADDVCEGRFHFLGYGIVELGRTPNWTTDFVCGLEWPQIALQNGDCVRFDGSDVKAPYELSRLQLLPVLGKTHLLTRETKYRDAAKNLLSCWIKENPVGIGVNWSLAMEAALRAMSICFLLNLLSPILPEEEEWLDSVTRSLWQHFLYIDANIEFSHLARSNHYLSNILGLYCLSLFLDGDRMAMLRRRYRNLLETEMLKQVYEDGGDYEASTGYHVLVTQMFTTALLLTRADGGTLSRQFVQRLQRMYRFMGELASPSGQLPHLGDCDDGRVELLLDDLSQMFTLPVAERNSLRVSGLLGLGKCLFGEASEASEEAAWYGLTGDPQSARVLATSADSKLPHVAVFPESGVARAKARNAEVLFFAAPNGIDGKGSHTHNDKLSLVLRLDGEEVLCDPGTGCYTRNIAMRNQFRRTRSHNTVVVDNLEQNTVEFDHAGLFRLGREAQVSRIQHGEEDGRVFLRASHSGYRSHGITHTRTVWLSLSDQSIIEDVLDGSGVHRFEVYFQLGQGWTVISVGEAGSQIACHVRGTRDLEIIFSAPVQVCGECLSSFVSRTYGSTSPASSLRFWGKAELPVSFTTRLRWAE